METTAIKIETKPGVGITQNEFEEIFNTWCKPIKNFIFYKCGDIKMAEDIVQETFLRIWLKHTEIQKNTIQSYLFTIAGNLFNDQFAHKKISLKFIKKHKNTETANSPEFEMEMKEFDEKLQKLLSELSENERVVFLMNRIDKFTYNEIAENLNISVKTVEKRMKNALDFLRKNIQFKF